MGLASCDSFDRRCQMLAAHAFFALTTCCTLGFKYLFMQLNLFIICCFYLFCSLLCVEQFIIRNCNLLLGWPTAVPRARGRPSFFNGNRQPDAGRHAHTCCHSLENWIRSPAPLSSRSFWRVLWRDARLLWLIHCFFFFFLALSASVKRHRCAAYARTQMTVLGWFSHSGKYNKW